MELFKLLGTIAVDNNDANKAIDDTTDKAEGAKGKMSGAFSKIGQGAVAVGKTIGVGLAVGATAMTALTTKALNLSGELEQNMGGSEAVFKDFAGKMQETAKTAFSNMGLSTSDFLGTANKMGALFQGAGFSIQESSELSASAMQRAADVASIMGISTQDAMEAVAGAAKGNFTMMDNLGVAMNDTAIQNYALSKGISKTTAEMTQQEKIGLAMEMFMDKTAYAAGNYAKENETLAGSLGTAKSALTNFLDGSGDVDQLVTAFSSAAEVIIKNVNEIFPRLVEGIKNLIDKITPMIPDLLNSLLPGIISGAITLINGLVAALPGILTALMQALPALIAGIQQIFNALVMALPQIMQVLVDALPTLIPQLVNAIISMIVTLITYLPDIIMPIIDALPQIIISIVNALLDNLPALIDGCVQLLIGLVEALPEIILSLLDAIPTVYSNILSALWDALPQILEGIVEILTSIWNSMLEYLEGVAERLKEFFKNAWEKVKEITNEVWNNIKSGISEKINNIKTTVSNVFTAVKQKVTSIWNGIKEAISKPIQSAKETVQKGLDAIKGFFDKIKLKFPEIKLPHFAIKGKFSLSPLSVPKLSIDWYKKAMNNAMLLDKPTIFGMNPEGQLMGAGEAGQEIVSGSNTLMGMIQGAVRKELSGIDEGFGRLISILETYFPEIIQNRGSNIVLDDGTIVGRYAPLFNNALGDIERLRGRGQ